MVGSYITTAFGLLLLFWIVTALVLGWYFNRGSGRN